MFFFKQNEENDKTPVISEYYIPSTNFNMDPKEFAKKKQKAYSRSNSSKQIKKRSKTSSRSKSNRSDSRLESKSISNSSKSEKLIFSESEKSEVSVRKIQRPKPKTSITKNFLQKFKFGNEEKRILKKQNNGKNNLAKKIPKLTFDNDEIYSINPEEILSLKKRKKPDVIIKKTNVEKKKNDFLDRFIEKHGNKKKNKKYKKDTGTIKFKRKKPI